MNKIAVLTDSGVGMPVTTLKNDGIYMLPLQISIDDHNYRDVYEISDQQLYSAQRHEKLCHTSCSNGKDISDTLQHIVDAGYSDVIFVPLSSGLSSQANFVLSLAQDYPLTLHFIDCYSTCMIQYHIAKLAKDMIDANEPIDKIIATANALIDNASSLVVPLSLQQLKLGGRLTPLAASMASLLKIKPILSIDKKTNGKLDLYEKVRTERKAIQYIIDETLKKTEGKPYQIYVIHSDCLQHAQMIKQECEKYPNLSVEIGIISSVISAHTGVDCLCIQAIPKL